MTVTELPKMSFFSKSDIAFPEKMLYDRNELEEDNQNIWKIIFKKDCNVLVFTKNDYQYFKINNLIKN